MFLRGKRAFSLIELMIVVAIMGILVAVALPQFSSMTNDAKVAKAKEDIGTLIKALLQYNNMEPKPAKSLKNLLGKYMSKIPDDPWGNKYKLNADLGMVLSFGADGKEGTLDDIAVSYLPPLMPISAQFVDSGEDNPGFVGESDEIVITFTRPIGNVGTDPDSDFEFFDAEGMSIETVDTEIKYYDGSSSPAGSNITFGSGASYQLDDVDLRKLIVVLGDKPVIIPGRMYLNVVKDSNSIEDMSQPNPKKAQPSGSPVLIRK